MQFDPVVYAQKIVALLNGADSCGADAALKIARAILDYKNLNSALAPDSFWHREELQQVSRI